jgi:hypothetical protein
MADKFLAGIHHGALHRALGISQDQKIPPAKLREALRSKDPHVRKMANLAKNMKSWKH